MKKLIFLIIILFSVFSISLVCVYGNVQGIENTLPSEQTGRELEQMTGVNPDTGLNRQLRAGPPGSGTGGGGPVGTTVVGKTPMISFGVLALIYLMVRNRKKIKLKSRGY